MNCDACRFRATTVRGYRCTRHQRDIRPSGDHWAWNVNIYAGQNIHHITPTQEVPHGHVYLVPTIKKRTPVWRWFPVPATCGGEGALHLYEHWDGRGIVY